jgi:hypothetical protein
MFLMYLKMLLELSPVSSASLCLKLSNSEIAQEEDPGATSLTHHKRNPL